jgi:hypothetical protein
MGKFGHNLRSEKTPKSSNKMVYLATEISLIKKRKKREIHIQSQITVD